MAALGGVMPKLTKVMLTLLLMLLPTLTEAEGLLRIGLQLHKVRAVSAVALRAQIAPQ